MCNAFSLFLFVLTSSSAPQISDRQHEELQQLRKHIRSCFERIGCFLMPHPGMKVATNPHFDGRVRDIEPDFISQLCILVPLLLRPDNLVVKVINGHEVTARELLEYFKVRPLWFIFNTRNGCNCK